MKTSEYIKQLSRLYPDPQNAFFRFDSIVFIVRKRRISKEKLTKQLKYINDIALLFDAKEEALTVLEQKYCEAIENSRSLLSENISSRDRSKEDDPVKKLYLRLQRYYDDYGKMVSLECLERACTEELIKKTKKGKNPWEHWSNLAYEQRVGKSKTDS